MKYSKCSVSQLRKIIKNATAALESKMIESNGLEKPFSDKQHDFLNEHFVRKEKQR